MSELGAFLKSKRSAIAPEAVGLPAVGNPRRVSGLRREEVAQLAAMSVDHYTRLEQGRVTTASDSVLNGIATALRLTDAERSYLRILAQPPVRSRSGAAAEGPVVSPLLRDLLDAMKDVPVLVKSFDHPVVGPLLLDWQALTVTADPDLTVMVFTAPPGSPTADSLRLLASWAASQ